MAEVTVSELAKSVGASEDRLLNQMSEAGLPHKKADEVVSDEEKQVLLAYLKRLHGDSARDPKKITLKRKKVETLRTGASTGKRTVNVEVRKKRTYVKREEEPPVQAQPPVQTPTPAPVQAQPPVEAPAKVEKEIEQPRPVDPVTPEPVVDVLEEAENRRLAALEARRKADKEEQARREAEERKRQEEAAAAEAEAQRLREESERETAVAKEAKAKGSMPPKPAAKDDKATATKPAEKTAEKPVADEEPPAKKKRGAGRAKVQSEHDNKDWTKHSHRPQDFLLHEDEELEAEEERARERAAEVAKIRAKNKHTFQKPTKTQVYNVDIPESISVADLAQRMAMRSGALVKQLMKMGEMLTANDQLDQETASLVVEEMGHKPVLVSATALEDDLVQSIKGGDKASDEMPRAPVVTVMGHVDHGKTSLLDYIRKSQVVDGEAGGITQHIGAYSVATDHGKITFLDTPGHAAFTAMRARGASCTDIVILVVAADDGVMPQTEEAVQHAKAAGVPIVVAVNKMDKEGADPDRVKNELAQKDVIPEDWGGDTQFVPVSAHTGEGIETLLESVSLQAELLELKAIATGAATGVIVESRMEKGRGAVCTTLVQTGALKRGDILLAGDSFGRVRAMTDEQGKQVKSAGPSVPVEILGLDSAPNAGDEFLVVPDERKAREVADFRRDQDRKAKLARQQKASLENMFASLSADSNQKKILSVVLKSDVRGSTEAIQAALLDLGNEEVGVNIVSAGVGGINESDMNLALTTGAIVLGFNVRADSGAKKLAEQESLEIRYYSIIYQLIDEVKQALSGMLDPDQREEIVGIAQVRDVFRSPKFGAIAGCMVIEGTVHRNKPIRVLRDNIVIYEGELESLRRFKDDVGEVRNGMECGIGVKDYNDVREGDQIEVFDIIQVERSL